MNNKKALILRAFLLKLFPDDYSEYPRFIYKK